MVLLHWKIISYIFVMECCLHDDSAEQEPRFPKLGCVFSPLTPMFPENNIKSSITLIWRHLSGYCQSRSSIQCIHKNYSVHGPTAKVLRLVVGQKAGRGCISGGGSRGRGGGGRELFITPQNAHPGDSAEIRFVCRLLLSKAASPASGGALHFIRFVHGVDIRDAMRFCIWKRGHG